MRGVLKRRGNRGGTCGGRGNRGRTCRGVLSLCLGWRINEEKKWQWKYVVALDGCQQMKITQQPTKSTPAQRRRWRRGIATGKGSTGEARLNHLGVIKLVNQINIKLMCLLKKNISPPGHRVNKKPRTLPSDKLLQRGYLEGIGWLPMAILLGPANGSIMVRHVLDVREGALPSNHTIPRWSLFPRFKYKHHSKNKMLRVLQMMLPFFPVLMFSGHSSWCSYFDTTDGYLRFIPDDQTTVPLFRS